MKLATLLNPYIRGIHDANGRLISDTTDYASGPNSNSEVLFTPDEDGTYYVAAGSYMGGVREDDVGTYTLQVSIDDFRPDTDTTGTVAVDGSVTGEIEAQGDRDAGSPLPLKRARPTRSTWRDRQRTAERWQIRVLWEFSIPMVTG